VEGDLQRRSLNLPYTAEYHGEAQVKIEVEVGTPSFVTLTLSLSRSRERERPRLMITDYRLEIDGMAAECDLQRNVDFRGYYASSTSCFGGIAGEV